MGGAVAGVASSEEDSHGAVGLGRLQGFGESSAGDAIPTYGMNPGSKARPAVDLQKQQQYAAYANISASGTKFEGEPLAFDSPD